MSDLKSNSEPTPDEPGQSQFTMRNLLVGMAVVAMACSVLPNLESTLDKLESLTGFERNARTNFGSTANSISSGS